MVRIDNFVAITTKWPISLTIFFVILSVFTFLWLSLFILDYNNIRKETKYGKLQYWLIKINAFLVVFIMFSNIENSVFYFLAILVNVTTSGIVYLHGLISLVRFIVVVGYGMWSNLKEDYKWIIR